MDDLLTGAQTTTFLDQTMVPVLPSGGTLDLRGLTARMQAATNARFGGPNSPQWRLVASGRLRTSPVEAQLKVRRTWSRSLTMCRKWTAIPLRTRTTC